MNENKKIVRIFLQTLKDITGATNENLAQYFDCTIETIRNRLKEKNEIKQIKEFCQNVSQCMVKGYFPSNLPDKFIEKLNKNDIFIPNHVYNTKQLDSILSYLLMPDKYAIANKSIYRIMYKLKNNLCLPSIIKQKLHINAERYNFFKVESVDSCSASILFWDLKAHFSYRVHIFFYVKKTGSYHKKPLSIYIMTKKKEI